MSRPAIDRGALIDSWSDGTPLSRHILAEVTHLDRVGHRWGEPSPLAPLDPVPGCEDCPTCETLRAGGDYEDAGLAATIVKRLAQRRPADRYVRARKAVLDWAAYGCTLPSADTLVALAGAVPGALREARPAGRRERQPLPVEAARQADILEVAERLGLGRPEKPFRSAREHVVRCFIHDDEKPSLRLDAALRVLREGKGRPHDRGARRRTVDA